MLHEEYEWMRDGLKVVEEMADFIVKRLMGD